MAKGRISAADTVLAAMVKDYKRLRRSLVESGGPDPELAALLERRRALAAELRELRQRIAESRRSRNRALPPHEAAALHKLWEAIMTVSQQLGLPVEIQQPLAPARRRRRRRIAMLEAPPQ